MGKGPSWATVIMDFILLGLGGTILISETIFREVPRITVLGIGTGLIGLAIGVKAPVLKQLFTVYPSPPEEQSSSSQSGSSTTGGP